MKDKRVSVNKMSIMAIFVAILWSAFMWGVPVFADNGSCSSNLAFPVDSVVHGRTYSEWSAAWWQWALSISTDSHPLFDTADCSKGQSGPVWFLGGKFCMTGGACSTTDVVRSCTIPKGTALFIPALNSADSVLEEESLHTAANPLINDMRQFIAPFMDDAFGLLVSIDGVRIKNLKDNFRVQSGAFGFTLPKDNLFIAIEPGSYPAGSYFPAVGDGYYVMLKPLPVGAHKIRIKGAVTGFALDITYNITVKK